MWNPGGEEVGEFMKSANANEYVRISEGRRCGNGGWKVAEQVGRDD